MKVFQGWQSAEGVRFKERTPISARYDGRQLRLFHKLKNVAEYQGIHTE